MQKLKIYIVLLGMLLVLISFAPRAVAQAENTPKQEDAKPRSISPKPVSAYRLEFTLNEVEDGKKLNTRSYSLLMQSGGGYNKLRVGANVPQSPTNALQYLDFGTNIDCRIQDQEGYVLLDLTIESSSRAHPEVQNDTTPKQAIVHQIKMNVNTVLTPGKPTVIASMDDPSSKRTYQVEATATKVK